MVGIAIRDGAATGEFRLRSHLNEPRLRPQHVADLFETSAKGIVEQVGIALGGLNLRMAEELADHRQRHPAGNEQGRKGVAKIMDANAGQFSLRPDIFLEPFDVLKRLAFGFARKHPFAILGDVVSGNVSSLDVR